MNNRLKIGLLFTVALVFVAFLTFLFLASRNTVLVGLSDDVSSINIRQYDEDEQIYNQIAENITEDTELRLRSGEYSIEPSGDRINEDPIDLVIEDDTEIFIDPDYSNAYISQLIRGQSTEILQPIQQALGASVQNYTIAQGTLHQKGAWYSTFIRRELDDPREETDIYRIVLKNSDSGWETVAGPDLILTEVDNPDVDFEVLSSVNNREVTFDFVLE